MKKTKPESNAIHREYGILSNCGYALGVVRRYSPKVLPMMAVGVVTGALMCFLWSYIGKYVIDLVQKQAEAGDCAPLLPLLCIAAAIEITVAGLNTICNNKIWFGLIFARMSVITEKNAKALGMDYQSLEDPDMLDAYQKATNACAGNDVGIEGLMHGMYKIVQQALVMAVTFTAVVVLDWRLILVIAAMSFAQFLFFRHTVKRDKKEVWDVLAPTWRKINYMERVTQDFDYAKDIRLFDMKEALAGKQHGILDEKRERFFHSRNLWLGNSFFSHAMSIVSNAAIYGVLIFCVVGQNMSIGDFTLYLGLSGTFSATLTEFLNSLGGFRKTSMETDDFRSFLDTAEKDEIGLPLPEGRLTFEFRHVSYRYKGAEDYALKDLNLTLEAGRRLAIVGMNGAGKTTLIKLLLRLYDPTEGEILLNGTDIRKFRRSDYYRLFSPVFQDVKLFAFPMSENVSMLPPESTDRSLAQNCLERSGLGEKLKSLPDGVDTQLLKVLYDDGVDLSGGEKQKLALARALYKNAPVVVLDEPTAALDPLAEYELYRSFDGMIQDKSAVYISHRLSSTRFCDKVAMFIGGELVEYGTHEELLAKGGEYAKMFEIQAQYYKEECANAAE